MADNDFLAFADADGANVLAQADYATLPALLTGFESGKANSLQLNKVWRQGSIAAYLIGQLIVDELGLDALDNGDLPTLLANFKAAIAVSSTGTPRTITAAGPQAILNADRNVIVRQAVAAAITLELPAAPITNFQVVILDGKGDADVNNITIDGNGHVFANGAGTVTIVDERASVGIMWDDEANVFQIV